MSLLEEHGPDVAIKETEKERSAFWWTRFTKSDTFIAGAGLGVTATVVVGPGRLAAGLLMSGLMQVVAKRGGNLFYWNRGNGDSKETNSTASIVQEKWQETKAKGMTFELFLVKERRLVRKYARGLKLDRYGKIAFIALPGIAVATTGVREDVLTASASGFNQATGTNAGEYFMRGANLVPQFSKLARTTFVWGVGEAFKLWDSLPSFAGEAKAAPLVPSDDERLGGSVHDDLLLRGPLSLERYLETIETLRIFKENEVDTVVHKLLRAGGSSDPLYLLARRVQHQIEMLIDQLEDLRGKFEDLERARGMRGYRFGQLEYNLREDLRDTVLPQYKLLTETLSELWGKLSEGTKGKVLVNGEWKDITDDVKFKEKGAEEIPTDLARAVWEYLTYIESWWKWLTGSTESPDSTVTEGGDAKNGVHKEGSQHYGENPTAVDIRCSRDPHEVAHKLAVDYINPGVRATFELKKGTSESALETLRKAVKKILISRYGNSPFNITPEKAESIVRNQIEINPRARGDHLHVALSYDSKGMRMSQR